MIDPSEVLAALTQVRDPETDEPITAMGFVAGVSVQADEVQVRLRLPTYFCAPNFTYLMMSDAQQAVESVAGRRRVHVTLEGHADAERLNSGIADRRGFSDVFSRQADGDLDEIRDRFRRKTFLIRQERLCRRLDAAGVASSALPTLTLGDLPPSDAREDYLALRAELGIPCTPEAVFLVAADGTPVRPERLRAHRRAASVLSLSFESNGVLCRTLLASRYNQSSAEEGAVA